ncbi:sulfotransferase family 2 domain-containing protein [Cyanothece sp. BG0011]|uniref:sulfotransferase family 2 domain-containing protein n=1 Tax=Cyanothece sp. BG0011 TaxID=2082950 RepID=UPI0018E50C0D|nr:sulfotransferase family 2 domain-containing protein [Cyanothece sp. BG0011]
MIHIPKTAGTSLMRALHRNRYTTVRPYPKYSLLNIIRKSKGIDLPALHAKANDFKVVMGERVWEDIFSFAFVRNPWDLMVSSYFWWLQIAPASRKERVRKQAEEIRLLGSFSAFINSVYGQNMINDRWGNLVDWIADEQGQIIVKFVGRFENLEVDWQHICKVLDFNDSKLSHRNQSKHRDYQSYYTDQTRKLIEHRFEWAIQEFQYKF